MDEVRVVQGGIKMLLRSGEGQTRRRLSLEEELNDGRSNTVVSQKVCWDSQICKLFAGCDNRHRYYWWYCDHSTPSRN